MGDVFLSYARPDSAAAERVARELAKCGRSVWFDRELPAHRPYSDVIASELESAAAVLVLWSKASSGSQWVRSEANRARELGKLVQARLDDVRLPMPFDQIQCADLRGWRGGQSHAGWTQVRGSIETLLGGDAPPAAPSRSPAISRRGLFIGGSAAAVALASIAGWKFLSAGTSLSPEAQLYLQKGMDELQSNDAFELNNPASLDQAITLLSEATRAAPRSSVAWGGLALAYASRKKVSPPAERAGLDARSRSAARQSLDIDPHDGRALGALRMLDPVYRHWSQAERADRDALAQALQPRMPLLLFLLGDVLASVGRWDEAAALTRKYDRQHFLIAGAERKAVINLWSAGNLEDADDAMRIAVEHWPHNPYVWRTHLAYLTFSGRPSEARDLLQDSDRPPEVSADYATAAGATIDALTGRLAPADAIKRNLDYLAKEPSAIFMAAHACAALGQTASVFPILSGYYFGEGAWRRLAPLGGDEDRVTAPLFMPPMRNAWRDPRFEALADRIGLSAYWRQSGTQPDFRRT